MRLVAGIDCGSGYTKAVLIEAAEEEVRTVGKGRTRTGVNLEEAAERALGEALEQVSLSRKGKLWSYTVHHYQPPPPYVPPDPFVPYAIAVVELPGEKLMVLGQVASGCDYRTLRVGMDMELVVEPLYEDREGNEHMVWKWRPCD